MWSEVIEFDLIFIHFLFSNLSFCFVISFPVFITNPYSYKMQISSYSVLCIGPCDPHSFSVFGYTSNLVAICVLVLFIFIFFEESCSWTVVHSALVSIQYRCC